MKQLEGNWVLDKNEEPTEQMILEDGRKTIDLDGCDWKAEPTEVAKLILKLSKRLKKGQEIVEINEGSDTFWYGIVKVKK